MAPNSCRCKDKCGISNIAVFIWNICMHCRALCQRSRCLDVLGIISRQYEYTVTSVVMVQDISQVSLCDVAALLYCKGLISLLPPLQIVCLLHKLIAAGSTAGRRWAPMFQGEEARMTWLSSLAYRRGLMGISLT